MSDSLLQQETGFITARDLSFTGILQDVRKSSNSLQPVFEAFTNALEAIKIRELNEEYSDKGEILISIFSEEQTDQSFEFKSLTIRDSGIGFNDAEFSRFNTFKDSSKGFKNLGSGRVQYVHFFDTTTVTSVFFQDGDYYEREFVLSKNKHFLNKNAIVKRKYYRVSTEQDTYTKVTFSNLLEKSNVYNNLSAVILKDELIRRYLHFFCFNSKVLPKIELKFYVGNTLRDTQEISETHIPKFDKKEKVNVYYSKLSYDATKIETLEKKEEFEVTSFKVSKNLLDNNDLKLISKGEVVEGTKINLSGISKGDNINGNKYLILVSGNFIDERDTNLRGELDIPRKQGSNSFTAFTSETIFIEDIEKSVNEGLVRLYPEIEVLKDKHENDLKELKEMFFIGDENEVDISFNDDDKRILEKYYEAQAKKEARIDASIKKSIDRLDDLDTSAPNYEDELESEINKLVKVIPEQNKRTLSHYVARRKLVLELFQKILDKKLKIQSDNSRNKDESLIHNLLFHQKSINSYDSDLWIINEDFIYFRGNSEFKLKDLEIQGKKVFKNSFDEEEERYLKSLGENRLIKRPDVLLFPEESKCIIIEFKSPDINVSTHLTQINTYASLIRNYTNDNFEIKTFFGYLIGEGIEPRDVQGSVSTFEHSYNFDYLYSPSQKVTGFGSKENGSIYTEVIKYSTLLQRAKLRNSIFMERLGIK